MNAIFKVTNECVRSYNRVTRGYEFVCTVNDNSEFYNKIQELEDSDFFPQDNGIVLTTAGNEAFDPKYPNSFNFGDYQYYLEDVESIDYFDEMHKVDAILNENPFNLEDILKKGEWFKYTIELNEPNRFTKEGLSQINENFIPAIDENNCEFYDFKKAYKVFDSLDEDDLSDGYEYELCKVDLAGNVLDWDNKELDSIEWKRNTWITKTNNN